MLAFILPMQENKEIIHRSSLEVTDKEVAITT